LCFLNFSNISSRFAAHYKSNSALNNSKETFRRLRALRVFTTDKIRRELTISQNAKDVTIQAETAYCHLKEVGDEKLIKIYAPKRSKDLKICLATDLPLALLEYLKVEETNIGILSSIISANSLAVVDAIIDRAGIISLVGVERLEDDDDETSEADDDEQSAPQAAFQRAESGTPPLTSTAHHLLVIPADRSHSRSRSADSFHRSPSSGSSSLPSFVSTSATSISDGPVPQSQSEMYKKLLMAVVDAARNLARVPQCGFPTSATSVVTSLSLGDVNYAVQGSDVNEKIGAAGELFVS